MKADDGDAPQNNDGKRTVVDHFGFIHIKGNMIVDKNDTPVALHGMSLFWSQWGGRFYNADCIRWLRDDWKCTVVRAVCGIHSDGYLTNPKAELAKITTVIDACIDLGIYVIVDWHDHNAEKHLRQSKEFFRTIAQKYGSTPNLIYEIYNEPLKVSWDDVIKPYAEEVLTVIRHYAPDNLVIVGTSHWAQDVDVAAQAPISDSNVAYSFHFYTSDKWHKQNLRDKAIAAIKNGLPIFITEYGISESNGNGIIDSVETTKWFSFVDKYGLSTCNWSIMDKEETSAALKPGANAIGHWNISDLSMSGVFIRNRIRALNEKIFQFLDTETK
jgi:Cellulase (glycosyl hydrolase family 5).